MRACLHSLSLVHCPRILSNSDTGMLTNAPKSPHRLSLMMSRTVERFSGVRLGSGNKNRESTYAFFSARCSEKLAWTPGVKGHIIKETISGWTAANLPTILQELGRQAYIYIYQKYRCSNSECVGRSRLERLLKAS